MFNKQNFCHIASNNRNDVKVGVFVYKTTDDLDTVKASGYFNEKIIDINLHDFIIHEWHDPTDRTNVEYNLLCVTERTLDNVGTQVIKSDVEKSLEEEIESLDDKFVLKTGDTMSGPLSFSNAQGAGGIFGYTNGIVLFRTVGDTRVQLAAMTDDIFMPYETDTMSLGAANHKWLSVVATNAYLSTVYTAKLNNGGDLLVPAVSGVIATKADVDLAANSGDQLTNKGVWYAKMYAATVAPAAEDGTNYADFSQTDGQGNPIIVIYERQSGAWVQTDTITPPADYNGYVTVTSKIWDIPEQSGQQGGKILWSHNQKTFTPYPQIISFEDAALTGNSTVQMPQTPTGNSIVNVDYLSNHTGSGKNVGDVFFTMRTDSGLAGAVECNGATYNTTDFVGSGSIGGLLADGKIPYVSLATYETLLTTNGSVGVFGWDGVGTTAFRVPSLNDIFVETGTAAQIGDYIAPAVPNITGSFVATTTGISGSSGAIAVASTYQSGHGWDGNGTGTTYNLNASRSSSVYKDGTTTVQPNTVRYRAMVQLAVGATDEALETCTSVLADVAELKYDYVVDFQAPTAANDYTWYRKYKSGWVEQGGMCSNSGSDEGSVILPVQMADTAYTLVATNQSTTTINAWGWVAVKVDTKTTTGFTLVSRQGTGNTAPLQASWQVSGVAAQ